MGDMCRNPADGIIHVGAALEDSLEFPIHTFSGARVHVPASENTVTTLTVYGADRDEDGATFDALQDSEGNPLVVPISGPSIGIELPPSIFPTHRIKLVADAISAGETIPYRIVLKS